jgi:hypothetical protein
MGYQMVYQVFLSRLLLFVNPRVFYCTKPEDIDAFCCVPIDSLRLTNSFGDGRGVISERMEKRKKGYKFV